jgi:hypothetical protein
MQNIIETRDLGTIEGFHILAHIVPDEITSITDYAYAPSSDDDGPYSDEAISDYWAGHWCYVGTIVTASKAGVKLGETSLWGSEQGNLAGQWVSPLQGDGDDFANGYGPMLIREAIDEARATLRRLTDEAIDAATGGEV